jgi:hypothetical protein
LSTRVIGSITREKMMGEPDGFPFYDDDDRITVLIDQTSVLFIGRFSITVDHRVVMVEVCPLKEEDLIVIV